MKKKKKVIIIASILFIIVVIGAVWITSSNRNKVTEVETEKVEPRNLSQVISVTGNIEANNKEEIALTTQQKVIEVFTAEGQEVKAGDPILKIDSADYEYQLKKNELSLSLANSNLGRLLDNSRKNDKKELENTVRQAELNLENSEANYNEAKRKYEQTKALYDSGAVSKEAYDATFKSMNDLKNQYELTELALNNAVNSLNNYDANRNDQINDQRNQLEGAKADIANTKDKIEDSLIKSSINGRIIQLDVKSNQYPTAENSIIAIYDLSQYKVKIQVSQFDAVSINKGQKASIKIKGIDKTYEGTITEIGDAAVITVDGTNKEPKVEVEVTLDNPDDKIKAGYEADIDITLNESQNTAAVNFESVLEDESGKKYVLVIENDKAAKKYITTGLETDFEVQVLEGLKTGDTYIKNPPATLKEGDPVKQSGGKNSDNKS